MSRVGEKIKSAREKSGLSQKALAKKLGLAEKYINEVELGRKVINEAMIARIGKVLNTDLNDISMVVTDEDLKKEKGNEVLKKPVSSSPKVNLSEVNDDWSSAFSSVLKKVPIYNYNFDKELGYRELPVHSNRINGYSTDKVIYITIEDDDMIGFRIAKGDIALVHLIKEIESNGIYLIDHKNGRVIRQIKKLDNTKALLINNRGSVNTETVNIKEIKPIAKLDLLEIKF